MLLDLAAFNQTDLSTATDDFTKLLQGELPRGLAKVMPELKDLKENGASAAEMMALVNSKIKGSAESDVSPLIQLQNTLGDIAEEIGKMILPAVTMLKDAFTALPSVAQKIIVIAPLLGSAFMVMGGPVTMVAGAVGLLVIAFGQLYKSYQENKKAWEETQAALNGIANEAKLAGVRVNDARQHVYDLGVQGDLTKISLLELNEAMAKANIDEKIRQDMQKKWRAANKQSTKEDLKQDADALKQRLDNQQYFALKKIEYQNKLDNDLIDIGIKNDEREKERQAQIQENMRYGNEIAARMDEERISQSQVAANNLAQIGMAVGMAMSAGIGKGSEGMKESLKAVLNLGLDFLQNKLLTATASAIFDGIMTMGTSIPAHLAALAAGTVAIQGARAGIDRFESGTNYAPGGMALVGERGAELVNLPRGSSVMNSTQTNQTINNAAPTVVVLRNTSDRQLQRQIERMTRNKSIDWSKIMAMA